MDPRRRALRWVLALLAAAVLAGVWIGSLFLRAHQILARHRQETRAFLQAIPAAATERPAIFDPPEPGEAWSQEMEALHRFDDQFPVGDDPPSLHRLSFLGERTNSLVDEEELAKDVERAEPHLDLIRSALRRSQVLPPKRPGWSTNQGVAGLAWTLRHSATLRHRKGDDLAAMERLVLSWGLAQDLARHGDREPHDKMWDAEVQGALTAKAILESHSLSSRELEVVARWLDRLATARPPLSRAIDVDDALERNFIADPDAAPGIFISDALRAPTPTWRELWSPTLHDAKRVATIARASQAVRGIDALPPWEWEAAAQRKLEAMDLSACESWELPNELGFRFEARALTYVALLRMAVAVAWYESEHAAFPTDLKALVPKYLRSVEVCPSTGRPFLYAEGRVWIEVPPEDQGADDDSRFSQKTAVWRVARKPK